MWSRCAALLPITLFLTSDSKLNRFGFRMSSPPFPFPRARAFQCLYMHNAWGSQTLPAAALGHQAPPPHLPPTLTGVDKAMARVLPPVH